MLIAILFADRRVSGRKEKDVKVNTEDIEHDDDIPIGRVLSRREVLTLLAGLGGAAVLAACNPFEATTASPTAMPAAMSTSAPGPLGATTQTPLNAEAATAVAATPAEASPTADMAAVPQCIVRPETTEGPYFVDEKLNRSDIRSDPSDNSVREGVPLSLAFVVSQVGPGSYTPLQGAQVDVWHCDADGVYSGVEGSPGTRFLRGYQVTDAGGKAQFTTIYPGWYRGRAVHIHFKIRTTGASGGSYDFTSQLFFDDAMNDAVFRRAPYRARGEPDTTDSTDALYNPGGRALTLRPRPDRSGGYRADFRVGLSA